MDCCADILNVKQLVFAATQYDIPPADDGLLQYLLQTECKQILDDCNVDCLFPPLNRFAEERVAGRYLQLQRGTILGTDGVDVVTSIKEGDTTVQLGGTSPEARLQEIAAAYLKERDLACYRRLRW